MKTYKLKWYGETYEVTLVKHTYQNNNTLAIELVIVENGEMVEPWGMVTVNIDSPFELGDNWQFVDTNNGGEEIAKWLVENKIAKDTGFKWQSGWCVYPLFSFNI